MMTAQLNLYLKNLSKMRGTFSHKREHLINFLSLQASTAFYNNFYTYFFNLYLFRLIHKYETTYKVKTQSPYMGSLYSRHHMVAFNNLNPSEFKRLPLYRTQLKKPINENYYQNIQFFYKKDFLSSENKKSFFTDTLKTQKTKYSIDYNRTIFNKNYDTSLLFFTWADFFSPGLFNYSPTRFWFLFICTPTFIKYKSNWLVNSIDDFYLIFFFARIFTLRLHKTIPMFLIHDLKLIFYEVKNDMNLTTERETLYFKSLEGIFEGLLTFSNIQLYSRSELLFFQGSWLDCLHIELFEETSRWVMPIKEEIDWTVFQGDLDDWWESLFYIFLSESYIWPFTDYSDQDFIRKWKNKIKFKNFDLMDFFFIDFSFTYLKNTPNSFFSNVGSKLLDQMWTNFINGNFLYIKRKKNKFQIIGTLFLTLNTWILSGLAGRDRRILLFRFFYLLVLKGRGFFFYWYMILLKPNVFTLPWEREMQHIEIMFTTNQQYYKNKVMIELRKTYQNHMDFFSKPFSFRHFWTFFNNNIWDKLVIQKRNKLEPNFIFIFERLLVRKPRWAYKYTQKITKKVYIALFWDFFYYKLYYWYLLLLCFNSWWKMFKNNKIYINKLIIYFFDEEQKLLRLTKQNKINIFHKIKYKNKSSIQHSNQYKLIKKNILLSLLLNLQKKKYHEMNIYWFFTTMPYTIIFQRALNIFFQHLLMILKNIFLMCISIIYEKIVDFNIGKIARLALKNQADMWFHSTNIDYLISGVQKEVSFTKTNKQHQKYTQSLTAMLILFTAKLDNVDWFLLIRIIFYYFPLKFVYFSFQISFFCIIKFCKLYLICYVFLFKLIIDIKYVIKLYHTPTEQTKVSQYKLKLLWQLQLKIKSKKLLTTIINYNLHSINFIYYIFLHLKKAKGEYLKAKIAFKDIPILFPFFITGEIKPNNYMIYIYLFTLCTQIWTAFLLLIGFCGHWFIWIFRTNWNKWYLLQFIVTGIIYCLITIFLFILIIIFFVGNFLYQSSVYCFIYGLVLSVWRISYLYILKYGIFLINYLKSLVKTNNLFSQKKLNILYKKTVFILNVIFQFNLKKKKKRRLLCQYTLQTWNKMYFIFHDYLFYLIYISHIFWLNMNKIIYQFWLSILFIILSIICFSFMLYDLYLSFYTIWYHKKSHDFVYFRSIWAFIKSEFYEAFSSIKEIIFIGSLGLRFLLMCCGFLCYIIYQIGWRFRIFESKKEKTKKLWVVPTKYAVLRFIDKWILYFFYRIRQIFFFNYKSFILYSCYLLYTFFFFSISYGFYSIYYIVLFIYFILKQEIPCLLRLYSNKYNKSWVYISNFIVLFKYLNKLFLKIIKNIYGFIYKNWSFYYSKKKLNLFVLWSLLIYLNIVNKCIWIYNTIIKKYINKSTKNKLESFVDLDITIRDFQELLVFINKNYNFITFYWSTVLQISIDYGDFGWWLPYTDKKYMTARYGINFILKQWRILSIRDFKINKLIKKKKSMWLEEKKFHKKHTYFFALNKITKPLLRKKAFVNDYIYNSKTKSNFLLNYISRFYNFFGLSFLFEIMFQRFKTPISQFFFLQKKGQDLFLLTRLQKMKDTFSHLKWHNSWLRDTTQILVLDEFGKNLWNYFQTKYQSKKKYFLRRKNASVYPINNTTTKFVNQLFMYKININLSAIINLLKFCISFFFYLLFFFFFSSFFIVFSVIIFFFLCSQCIVFIFNLITFYFKIKLNIFHLIWFFLFLLLYIYIF